MDDEKAILFKAMVGKERLEAYGIYKEYLKQTVEAAIGWDEEYQQCGFNRRLQSDGFHWVVIDNIQVGLVYFKNTEQSTHLHLLIIFFEAQRRGIASRVTNQIRSLAHKKMQSMTLSCFKNNLPAIALYKKLGFNAVSEDEHFYDFVSEASTKV